MQHLYNRVFLNLFPLMRPAWEEKEEEEVGKASQSRFPKNLSLREYEKKKNFLPPPSSQATAERSI